jgi:DNA adenine methylase
MEFIIKPLLKWAGGKTQILPHLISKIPDDIENYAEPFVGGGALLFALAQKPNIKNIYISDTNAELMLMYRIVRDHPNELIDQLLKIENLYNSKKAEQRELFYYKIREKFNKKMNEKLGISNTIEHVAQSLFLNRTCFNGLWRVNSKTGHFNVPFNKAGINFKTNGKIELSNHKVCFPDNLIKASKILNTRNTAIVTGGYQEMANWEFINHEKTFIYFDPPYRPLSKTASFVKYSKDGFNDDAQVELAKFFNETSLKNKVMLSNSNPEQIDPNDDFFRNLYSSDEFSYEILLARRSINSAIDKRKKISEILVHNC